MYLLTYLRDNSGVEYGSVVGPAINAALLWYAGEVYAHRAGVDCRELADLIQTVPSAFAVLNLPIHHLRRNADIPSGFRDVDILGYPTLVSG